MKEENVSGNGELRIIQKFLENNIYAENVLNTARTVFRLYRIG